MKVVEKNIDPICPYCEKKITEIIHTQGDVGFLHQKTGIYCCQHCHKILGVSR